MNDDKTLRARRWTRYHQSRIKELRDRYKVDDYMAAEMQKAHFEMTTWPWSRSAERITDPKELLERRLERGRDLAIVHHHFPEWPLSQEQGQLMQEYLDTSAAKTDPALAPLPPLGVDDSGGKRSFFSRRKRT
jgi:hypothetical protein